MKTRAALLAVLLGIASIAACSSDSTGSGSVSSAASSDASSGTSSSASSGGQGGAGGGQTSASSSASSGTGGAGGGGMMAFSLTSSAFTEGMAIPPKHSCKGMNVSPPLAWTAGPAGTKSYAVVLTDKSNNLIHWVIWDIPGGTLALPEGVENMANPATPAGSKQVKSYDNQTFGYLGPCPPNTHTYEFAVFALDVATLPNVTTASTRAAVDMEIMNHDLTSATLTGTFTP